MRGGNFNQLLIFIYIPLLIISLILLILQRSRVKESLKLVQDEYNKLGEHNLDWYDVKYWISYFGLEISSEEILEKYEPQIKIFTDVIPVLEKLKENFLLIIVTAMPREFLTPKMTKLKKYFKFTFSALSNFKELKNSEIYLKICQILKVNPAQVLHIGDHWKFDYLAAHKAGMNALYLDRSNTKKGKFIINNLTEIKRVI